jgi:hypothetical protein
MSLAAVVTNPLPAADLAVPLPVRWGLSRSMRLLAPEPTDWHNPDAHDYTKELFGLLKPPYVSESDPVSRLQAHNGVAHEASVPLTCNEGHRSYVERTVRVAFRNPHYECMVVHRRFSGHDRAECLYLLLHNGYLLNLADRWGFTRFNAVPPYVNMACLILERRLAELALLRLGR